MPSPFVMLNLVDGGTLVQARAVITAITASAIHTVRSGAFGCIMGCSRTGKAADTGPVSAARSPSLAVADLLALPRAGAALAQAR
jgi:hypothetical protein